VEDKMIYKKEYRKINKTMEEKQMKKLNLNIKGMHCSSCSKLIETELQDKGIKAQVQDSGTAAIEFDENKISVQQIKDLITELGYQAL